MEEENIVNFVIRLAVNDRKERRSFKKASWLSILKMQIRHLCHDEIKREF